MTEPIKTPIGTAWFDEHGILWHRLDFGARITVELAEETIVFLEALRDGRVSPAIVDIGEITFAESAARAAFAGLRSEAEPATALLVPPSVNPAPGVLARQFEALESDRPIAVFETEEEAVAWAREFLPIP